VARLSLVLASLVVWANVSSALVLPLHKNAPVPPIGLACNALPWQGPHIEVQHDRTLRIKRLGWLFAEPVNGKPSQEQSSLRRWGYPVILTVSVGVAIYVIYSARGR